jgi:hypothetical protein
MTGIFTPAYSVSKRTGSDREGMDIWVSVALCSEGGECDGVERLLFFAGLFLAFMVLCFILAAIGAAFDAITKRFRSPTSPRHRHRYRMGKCECGELKGAAGSFELPMNPGYRKWQDKQR